MGLVQRADDLDGNGQRAVECQATTGRMAGRGSLEPRRQRFAFQVLHDEVGDAILLADVVQSADVRMIELRDGACLAIETGPELWICSERLRQHFDCDRAIESRVARAIDLAHAAGAEQRDDLVRAEASAWRQRHGGADYSEMAYA